MLVPVLQHYFHCHFDCLWHWNQLERMDESRIIFSVVFLESAFLDYALSETMMAVSLQCGKLIFSKIGLLWAEKY